MAESGKETKMFTLEEVKKHNAAGSAWLVIHDKVYDVTKFLDEVGGRFTSRTASLKFVFLVLWAR